MCAARKSNTAVTPFMRVEQLVVYADETLIAFAELESAIRA